MPDEQYLYGAAVQGIQSFILQTNELKDIVGASELVEQICTTKFAEVLGKKLTDLPEDPNVILMAAGNIKYLFTNREECKEFVRIFPRTIVEMAPGITISQAVVKLSGDFASDIERLEALLRTQRNKPMRSVTTGLTGILRTRTTGLPAVTSIKGEYLDAATEKKRKDREKATLRLCEKSFGFCPKNRQVAFDIEEMTEKNDWIAIIHADGNGLGKVVQKVGKNKKDFKTFSQQLDICTRQAAQEAYKAVEKQFTTDQYIPIRPIVLGGDDLTLICRADIAIPYLQTFLQTFENNTHANLGDLLTKYQVFQGGADKLTACAGIAFIKSSFPYYYGYDLAETLCTEAKKDAKKEKNTKQGLAPSCLMFHKVQDSFVENFSTIIKRELTPYTGYSFLFGPYYLNPPTERWSISQLVEKLNVLCLPEATSVKSHLRQWMSILHSNPANAEQKKIRLLHLLQNGSKEEREKLYQLVEEVTNENKSGEQDYSKNEIIRFPVYDLLSLHSINVQETKI